MATFINLTPHAVNFRGTNCSLDLPPCPSPARVSSMMVTDTIIDGVPVMKQVLGDIVGLPECQEADTFYIVSTIVALAAAKRGRTADILSPAQFLRDEEGRIIGCQSFVRQQ